MLDKGTLDPENRVLYGDSLQPPAGYTFDAAVATTFSLDFETALAVPVSLALFAAENRDEILSNPLALLEGAERIAGRLVIFTDGSHIQAQSQPHSRLCSLLEKIIVEVKALRDGAFHPKMWILRFNPIRQEESTKLRLLVLSRNITQDRSWDISLSLDGEVTRRRRATNRPLVDLLKRLPTLANVFISDDARELTHKLAEDVHVAEWDVPEPFESVTFAVNGLGGRQWQPESCARLGVISPFCDEETMSMLADLPTEGKAVFVGRPDELVAITKVTLDRFDSVAVLDEMAASEDGEEVSSEDLQGLHAKAFISESGWNTTITIGSGNATRPALVTGRNVELFASLTGKRSKVGGIDEIMGPKGFGRLTCIYNPGEIAPIDAEIRAAEARLDEARHALSGGSLRLRCERTDLDEGGTALWRVSLVPSEKLPLTGIGALSVWPITRGEGHRQDALEQLRQMQVIDLGAMPLVDLTRFLACRLIDATDKASALFSIGLVMEGLPAERNDAILRWVIDSRDAFFRYLRLLLSELGDPFGAALAAQDGSSRNTWQASADDAPLLEELVRAFCRGGDRLHAIERLMIRLEPDEEGAPNPIPDDFRNLWEAFRAALKTQESINAE